MTSYVAAIDQGTTSTRAILFDPDGQIGALEQREHQQIHPRAGWVEHDAREVWQRTREVIDGALARSHAQAGDVAAIGITNQRETTVVWDRQTGEPVHNAIVWQDTRTAALVRELAGGEGLDRLRERVGLPLSTYFSGPKIAWILDNVQDARTRAESGELAFGTMDTWLLWNLTGGPEGGVHATDVTNASRTMLMDLQTLDWHEPSLQLIGIPRCDAPGDPLLQRDLRRGDRHGPRRSPSGGHPRRPAGGAVRPDLLRARRGQEHLRHGLVPAAEHRRADRPLRPAAHQRRREGGRGADHLRARGLDRRDRRRRAVAARQARAHRDGGGGRGAGPDRAGQRRRVLRARLLRPVRPLLARRRPRRDRRADRVRRRRAHRPGGPRGDGLADPRGPRRGQRRRRGPAGRAAGRRRHDRRTSCSCSSRPTCSACR